MEAYFTEQLANHPVKIFDEDDQLVFRDGTPIFAEEGQELGYQPGSIRRYRL